MKINVEKITPQKATAMMMVTRGIPSDGQSVKAGVHTIDMFDRGRVRGVGQQLHLRHGIKNANKIAAICRAILMCACDTHRIKVGKNDVGACLRVLEYYKDEINAVSQFKGEIPGLRSSVIPGAVAFAMRAGSIKVLSEFLSRVMTGEGIGRGNPAFALRHYLLTNAPGSMGGGSTAFSTISRVTLVAAMRTELKEEMKGVKISEIGFQYYAQKQATVTGKLLISAGYRV